MSKIEVQSFFYDLIHCKDKILSVFNEFDEQYEEDERGSLVAGIKEMEDVKLVTLLVNIQKMAQGFEQIKELMDAAEDAELQASLADDEDDDDEDDD